MTWYNRSVDCLENDCRLAFVIGATGGLVCRRLSLVQVGGNCCCLPGPWFVSSQAVLHPRHIWGIAVQAGETRPENGVANAREIVTETMVIQALMLDPLVPTL
jgi:hypothetical protein